MNYETEIENFIVWPSSVRSYVTTACAVMFAQHCVEMETKRLQDEIRELKNSYLRYEF